MAGMKASGEQIKQLRVLRGWSQAELARRSAISRAAVSAIETNRLVPSVTAAIKLAACLERTVEELFGGQERKSDHADWAWNPATASTRYWRAEIGGRLLSFPVEETPLGEIPHDGLVSARGDVRSTPDVSPSRTLIVACCDPAAGLLAAEYARQTGFRMLVFGRSSGAALTLLKQGRVHVAGLHLAAAGARRGNASIVGRELSEPAGLLRVARWEEGVALAPSRSAATLDAALRGRLSWIGREPGSGARQCLDELLSRRQSPVRLARDHRSVASALREGWGDAGVCVRLVSEEAGLKFFSVRLEDYDLTYLKSTESDPRIQALVRVVRSAEYRRLLGELPGYDAADTGGLEWVKPRRRDAGRRSSAK